MDSCTILKIAALAGRIILENGGETYRVEETSQRVCLALGAVSCQSYAAPTAIILSITDSTGQVYTVVERINSRIINLQKIDAVNRFSRIIEKENLSTSQAWDILVEIENQKQYSNRTIVLFSALAAGAFAIIFNGVPRDFICAAFAGLLIRTASLKLSKISLNDFFNNTIGGAIATLVGWASVHFGVGVNMDIIIIASLMLLVPGLIITNAVRDIAAGDLVSGISRTMEAFFVAIAIACGTALGYNLISLWGGMVI